jgi:UDP-glucose 4-epimerase
MLIADASATGKVSAFNIGPRDDGALVQWIAEQVVARVSPGARIEYGQGNKGWVGDVPRFSYSSARIAALGWSPRLGSHAALTRAIDEIARAEGV